MQIMADMKNDIIHQTTSKKEHDILIESVQENKTQITLKENSLNDKIEALRDSLDEFKGQVKYDLAKEV